MTIAGRSLRLPLAIVACVVASSLVGLARQQPKADPAQAERAPLTERIPVDPRITTGQLANGLRRPFVAEQLE
jgi:hypothetical protein